MKYLPIYIIMLQVDVQFSEDKDSKYVFLLYFQASFIAHEMTGGLCFVYTEVPCSLLSFCS